MVSMCQSNETYNVIQPNGLDEVYYKQFKPTKGWTGTKSSPFYSKSYS